MVIFEFQHIPTLAGCLPDLSVLTVLRVPRAIAPLLLRVFLASAWPVAALSAAFRVLRLLLCRTGAQLYFLVQ